LPDGQFAKHAWNLKLSPDTDAGNSMFLPVRDVHAIDKDATPCAFDLAGHQVHQGGFSGAVGTEQDTKFAFLDEQ